MSTSSHHQKATFRMRSTAFLFDIIICTIFFFIFGNSLQLLGYTFDKSVLRIVNLEIFYLYNVVFVYFFGATIGKMMKGLRVATEHQKQLDIRTVIIREFIGKQLTFLLTLGIANLWILVDKNKQTPYDKIAKTFVVKVN